MRTAGRSSHRPSRRLPVAAAALVAILAGGCAPSEPPWDSTPDLPPPTSAPEISADAEVATDAAVAVTPERSSIRRDNVPSSMRACFDCHRSILESYLAHGMAASIGPVDEVPPGTVSNPATGMRYTLRQTESGAWLDGSNPAGGRRKQRVVGQIGAGRFDISWATEEVDPWTGERTGRLFFAPVELITEHGHELSPFAQSTTSPGLDFPLVDSCLTCHTLSRVERLPQASTDPGASNVFPANALGSDAFEHLEAFSCDACHGDSMRHVEIMEGRARAERDDLGLEHLADLPPSRQRDRCARCHLQGEARFELADTLDLEYPIAGQFPVLIAGGAPSRDFRFVGQLERLALSACFQNSPEMTCTTCHDPHTAVIAQGVESFDSACMACHGGLDGHADGASVEEITGAPARSASGCVDCHVRRSQPFDLPHVRTADHYVRPRIDAPQRDIPHRQFTRKEAGLELYDDGTLAPYLTSEAGTRWRGGVEAMGLVTLGQIDAAAERFARFPAPGTTAARTPTVGVPLTPLETRAEFHHMRGLTLMATGDLRDALAAFSDALEVDPHFAPPRLARAQIRHDLGDFVGALQDTEEVVQLYPEADAPWRLRASMTARAGRPDFAAMALERATELWPSDPALWRQLAEAASAAGRGEVAADAMQRAESLDPSRPVSGNAAPGR